jgi:hypothetical protein
MLISVSDCVTVSIGFKRLPAAAAAATAEAAAAAAATAAYHRSAKYVRHQDDCGNLRQFAAVEDSIVGLFTMNLCSPSLSKKNWYFIYLTIPGLNRSVCLHVLYRQHAQLPRRKIRRSLRFRLSQLVECVTWRNCPPDGTSRRSSARLMRANFGSAVGPC